MNTTTSNNVQTLAKPLNCHRCKATHFNYQLTCKRCGDYLHKDDVVGNPDTHTLAVAGGILAVSTALLAVCLVMHLF